MTSVLHLGPVPIHVWGLFVAVAFIVGTLLAVRRAPQYGVDPKHVVDFAVWCIVAAFIAARLIHVFVYEPTYYLAHPWDMLKIWEGGLSSFGGFVGAIVAALVFVRRRRIAFIALADTVIGALPIAYAIGRFGCHITRMHPGPPCSGLLCFPFPDDVQRLDLGLVEALVWVAIAIIVVIAQRRLVRSGTITALVVGLYGASRFLLDAYRVADARYGDFTPAQYGALALLATAALLVLRATRTPNAGSVGR